MGRGFESRPPHSMNAQVSGCFVALGAGYPPASAVTTMMSRYHSSADDVPDSLRIPHWPWTGSSATPARTTSERQHSLSMIAIEERATSPNSAMAMWARSDSGTHGCCA